MAESVAAATRGDGYASQCQDTSTEHRSVHRRAVLHRCRTLTHLISLYLTLSPVSRDKSKTPLWNVVPLYLVSKTSQRDALNGLFRCPERLVRIISIPPLRLSEHVVEMIRTPRRDYQNDQKRPPLTPPRGRNGYLVSAAKKK